MSDERSLRAAAALAMLAAALPACGSFVRQSRSPSQLVIVQLLTAPGTDGIPASFSSGPLQSHVGNARGGEAVVNDFGEVTLRVIPRDPGGVGSPAAPSPINTVTVQQYRVRYRGSPGIDVPHGFDGAVTFTVPADGTGVGVFELVRHVAKMERPLASLAVGAVVLTAIADVTFYGRDQAGHTLSATGSVQINFGNFR